MRRGEALGLHWADVHLAERMLFVRWNLTAIDNNRLHLGRPKTKASRNWVSLSPRARLRCTVRPRPPALPCPRAPRWAGWSSASPTDLRYALRACWSRCGAAPSRLGCP